MGKSKEITLAPDCKITYGDKSFSDLYTEWFVQWVNRKMGRTVLVFKDDKDK